MPTPNRLPTDAPLMQLVFSGECLPGFDPERVRASVAAALKLDARRTARLFSGRRRRMGKPVTLTTAHKRVARFAMMGAVLRAEPVVLELPVAPEAPAPTQAELPLLDVPVPAPAAAVPELPVLHEHDQSVAPRPPSVEAPSEAPAPDRFEPTPPPPPPPSPPSPSWPASPVPAGVAGAAAAAAARARPLPPIRLLPAEAAQPSRRRLLNALGVAVGSIAGGLVLGVVLGPGIDTWLEPSTPREVPAVSTAAGSLQMAGQSAVDAAPAVPAVPVDPRAPTGPRAATPSADSAGPAALPPDMSVDATNVYRAFYLNAPGHKAFAISADGAHGWRAGARSQDEARGDALARCMSARARTEGEGCRVIDADGQLEE